MDYERKSLYWIFALLLLIIAPIVILITPMIVSLTISDSRDKIVFIPLSTSMVMYALAFLVVIVLFCVMYFSRSVLFNSITGIIVFIGFIFMFSQGVQNYVYLHQDYIEYNPVWGSNALYNWGELASVSHEMYDEDLDRDEKYIFEFKDGYTFEFLVSGLVNAEVQSKIYQKLVQLDVPYKEY
ncbi:hypothetical protein M9R32_15550 [Paenisporosarcina quisquiliarum]|uniref:Uncharacterized protein n=1 Tax=Paenisporosarcina quisquiliarum TaxID=365346 RepID=A0A9X3RFE5_9BACL|nr:hypothetical protein [Paenisporosarcina quisquiliarum]MCZ8538592.1 hypothetical protein [Paenisporosarcina quisquiliarum]